MDAGTFWLPEQASTLAPGIDSLFYFVLWTSVILFVLVVAGMVYFAIRYRRTHAGERPEPIRESKLLEVSWIVIPTILVLLVFNWGFKAFIEAGVAPPNSYEITVRGGQWNWEFQYPNGVTSNELHVPVDRPVRLTMSSRDVIHSLFIPAFRVKHDVLPNRYTSLWFEATRQDTFDIFCTEYCGTQHSAMDALVVVQSQGAFDDWLASGGGLEDLPPVELGAALYEQQGCAACHSLDGSQMTGPTFQNLAGSTAELSDGSTVEVDANYLRSSILEPGAQIVAGYQNLMPSQYSDLSEEQLTGLIAFIQSESDLVETPVAADTTAAEDDAAEGAAADTTDADTTGAGAADTTQAGGPPGE